MWARKLAARYTNTDTQERTHKDLKPSDSFTNNHLDVAKDQVSSGMLGQAGISGGRLAFPAAGAGRRAALIGGVVTCHQ